MTGVDLPGAAASLGHSLAPQPQTSHAVPPPVEAHRELAQVTLCDAFGGERALMWFSCLPPVLLLTGQARILLPVYEHLYVFSRGVV